MTNHEQSVETPTQAEKLTDALANGKVRVDDNTPVFELPDGSELRLNVHVDEWSHDQPRHGEAVEMEAEVCADDWAWWTLYPERSDVGTVTDHEDFPVITIEPEVSEE